MSQGKITFAMLSLALVSACSLQTTQTPALGAREEVTHSYAVFFPFDSAKFDDDGVDTGLSSALTRAQQAQSARIQLIGHTDRAGPAEYNMKLSKRRADAVAAALVNAGISPGTIEISIRGEEEPQTPTSDGRAEAANRRVDIAVVSLATPKQAAEPATVTTRPDDCTVMPVYVAGTRVYSCMKTFEQVHTQ